jgi:transposase
MCAVSGLQGVELSAEGLGLLLERLRDRVDPKDYLTIVFLVQSLQELYALLADRNLSLQKLRRVLFGSSTEKTDQVLGEEGGNDPKAGEVGPEERAQGQGEGEGVGLSSRTAPEGGGESPEKRKGHGRNGAEKYPGAERVPVALGGFTPGCGCPSCQKGKVYTLKPGPVIRFTARAFLLARIYELERWRCNLCGEVFTAELPAEAGQEKYDATVAAMIAVLKYGSGIPFYRLEQLQESLGVPFPASTQWELVEALARTASLVLEALIEEAAQGTVVHNDDTDMTVLSLLKSAENAERAPAHTPAGTDNPADESATQPAERTGVFTSGIVTETQGHQVALYFTGREHAGERLAEVLAQRHPDAEPPIQMCDGLSRNTPGEFETLLANCLAHGRRKFVEIAPNFPGPCRTVLESLREVYRNDALAKERRLSPEERLAFHQAESGPVMDRLHDWMAAQLAQKLVEPNSGLGKAITYMLNRWEPLTLFLRKAGAPLDNNLCERVLKMAILHRKNALFFKTENGAWVGDLFMSLIHTCRLNGANPFDYLTQLQKNADHVAENPKQWLPWNYRDTLQAMARSP